MNDNDATRRPDDTPMGLPFQGRALDQPVPFKIVSKRDHDVGGCSDLHQAGFG